MSMISFEHNGRSVAKAMTYRGIVTLTSYVVLLALSGNQAIALSFTGASIIYTTIIYFAHERAWSYVQWGMNNNGQKYK